jgi:hypothetical protein
VGVPFLTNRVRLTAFDENDILVYTKEIDVTVTEQHGIKLAVTKHPVAKGIPVTDNIRVEPLALQVVAFFSDFPARIDDVAQKVATGESSSETYEQLCEIATLGWRWTVKTSLKEYTNMAIENISVPRAVDKANAITATINFIEIRKASSATAALPDKKPTKAKNKKTQKKGAKPKAKVKDASLAKKLTGSKIVNAAKKLVGL